MPVPPRLQRRYDRRRRAALRTRDQIERIIREDERGHHSRIADLRDKFRRK